MTGEIFRRGSINSQSYSNSTSHSLLGNRLLTQAKQESFRNSDENADSAFVKRNLTASRYNANDLPYKTTEKRYADDGREYLTVFPTHRYDILERVNERKQFTYALHGPTATETIQPRRSTLDYPQQNKRKHFIPQTQQRKHIIPQSTSDILQFHRMRRQGKQPYHHQSQTSYPVILPQMVDQFNHPLCLETYGQLSSQHEPKILAHRPWNQIGEYDAPVFRKKKKNMQFVKKKKEHKNKSDKKKTKFKIKMVRKKNRKFKKISKKRQKQNAKMDKLPNKKLKKRLKRAKRKQKMVKLKEKIYLKIRKMTQFGNKVADTANDICLRSAHVVSIVVGLILIFLGLFVNQIPNFLLLGLGSFALVIGLFMLAIKILRYIEVSQNTTKEEKEKWTFISDRRRGDIYSVA